MGGGSRSRSFAYALATSVCALTLLSSHSVCAQSDKPVNFDITSTDLGQALNQFAQQSNRQIMFVADSLAGRRAMPLHGQYLPEEALDTLLSGSGLTYRVTTDNAIVVSQAPSAPAPLTSVPRENPKRADAATKKPEVPGSRSEINVPIEEVIVTGSRIVREGYESPTPLSVISSETISNSAGPSIMSVLGSIPAMTGNSTNGTNQASFAAALVGLNSLNLRSLGTNRVLVLVDGQRTVGSHTTGVVDISSLPQGLISRVDVVTGGASAVYGSDAVAGVVNFVLNKEFTGLKGELSGGMTNHSDGQNYKISLNGGFGFADARGHVLLAGERVVDLGIHGNNRSWNGTGYGVMNNPLYTATNGLPRLIVGNSIAEDDATFGGLIVSGPLKGIAFGDRGVPYNFNYGPLTADPWMQGGDWQTTNYHQTDLMPRSTRENTFMRTSYDITDDVNVYFQALYSRSNGSTASYPVFQPGALGNLINIDNAFLPASVRAQAIAAGVTQFRLGTWNGDLPKLILATDRQTTTYAAGVTGRFEALGTDWNWQLALNDGVTRSTVSGPNNISTSRFRNAIDAVVNPTTGLIVCRSTLTNPNNGCHAWNIFGTNVNATNDAAWDYFHDVSKQHAFIWERVYAASLTGEPFTLFDAGPDSIALSMEYRQDAIDATVDALSAIFDHPYGSASAFHGGQDVTEGAFETLVPLIKGASWADNWDVTGAVRYTSYTLAGNVVTWKLGTTYSPVPDIKFRATRSRDIRAPNISELFGQPNQTFTTVFDPVTNTSPNIRILSSGNTSLKPEKANTLGIGAVLQPRFLENFSASIDYWDVNINAAIANIGNADIVALCASGAQPQLCAQVMRVNGVLTQINQGPVNLAKQNVRGIDFEASYHFGLESVVPGWLGTVMLHGNATAYLRNIQDTIVAPATNRVGVAGPTGTGSSPPNWKLVASATYALDPIAATLTARAISSGLLDTQYIECSSGCPTSTALNPTINNNHVGGAFYLDANVSYAFNVVDDVHTEAFISAQNILNRDPEPLPNTFYYPTTNPSLYDALGVVFRAGIRFKM